MMPPAPTRMVVVAAARCPITTAVAAVVTIGMLWCSATQIRRYPRASTCRATVAASSSAPRRVESCRTRPSSSTERGTIPPSYSPDRRAALATCDRICGREDTMTRRLTGAAARLAAASTLAAMVAMAGVACSAGRPVPEPAPAPGPGEPTLDQVRAATERYRDVQVALADGYVRDPFDL